jgi:hypothetical protein
MIVINYLSKNPYYQINIVIFLLTRSIKRILHNKRIILQIIEFYRTFSSSISVSTLEDEKTRLSHCTLNKR